MSVWGGILDRGSGDVERKEDKVILVGPEVISPAELAKMLNTGIVHFQYRKKPRKGQPEDSGEIRDAWGTRKNSVITKIPYGGECPPKRVGYSIYFDLEKEDWRAFLDGRLVGVWNKVYDESEFEVAYAKFNAKPKDEVIPDEL